MLTVSWVIAVLVALVLVTVGWRLALKGTMSNADRNYIPALRFRALTRFYDLYLRTVLPEQRLKQLLVDQVSPRPAQRVLDIGCGTATLTIMLKQACTSAEVTGLDCDEDALAFAKKKTDRSGASIDFHLGSSMELPFSPASFDHVVSSLTFHHLKPAEKLATLEQARNALRPGGEIHIMDWGQPRTLLMSIAVMAVRLGDGFETTDDNVKGRIPELMTLAGFSNAQEVKQLPTVLGPLSYYHALA
jgi:ubiquinone/menaquinone biosynthesis C-methylase UbiE